MSFTGAAARLHISQPAITAQIQRLEEDLGVQLLDRNRRSVKLTRAGEAFLAGARKTLLQAEEAVQAARKAAQLEVNRLRMSCPPSALREIVPGVIAEFHQMHPDVKLDLFTCHTSTTISRLQDESVDIGYVRLPVEVRGLKVVPVHREPLIVCLPRAHRLEERDHIRIADLQNEKFILYGREWAPGFHDRLAQACSKSGFTPTVVSEIDEMYLAPTLVAAGIGIAVLPKMVVSSNSADIVVRDLAEDSVFSEIGVASRAADASAFVASIEAISRVIGRRYSLQPGS